MRRALGSDRFDVAHCRLLLCHLQRPQDCVLEMTRTVKPGGMVVCADIDLARLTSIPATPAYTKMRDLYLERRQMDGLVNDIGPKLAGPMLNAGLTDPEMAIFQPVYFRGEKKRLWELTFTESSARTLEKGIISELDLQELLAQLADIARNDQIAVAQAPMCVCWARKPFDV